MFCMATAPHEADPQAVLQVWCLHLPYGNRVNVYVLDKVGSYAEGTALAKDALARGAGIEQLRACIDAQNVDPASGHAALDAWLA